MTAPHYYGSTSGILVDRFLKYGVYPFAYGAGLALSKDHDKATKYAQMACLVSAAMVTTTFFGLEADMIDTSARDAVSAEKGVDVKQIEFSDYKNCDNIIVKKAYSDLIRLQKYRYGTDLLFVLPSVIEMAHGKITGKQLPPSKDVIAAFDSRHPKTYNPKKFTPADALLQGHVGWAMSVYAGKAAYWTYETFKVQKTGYYEVVKLRENLESTGRDIKADDLKAIYQRTRTDQNLPMVGLAAKAQNDALKALFTRMAAEYNKHDGKFDIADIVYLIGGNRINIHGDDHKTFSEAAVLQSHKEIDKLLAMGLSGVREQNRRRNEHIKTLAGDHASLLEGGTVNANTPPEMEPRSFSERFTNSAVHAVRNVLSGAKMIPKRPEEYISVRDPTDLVTGIGITR